MVTFDPLQPLHDLDRSSPQFHTKLSDLLHGQEYRNLILNLKSDHLARLVEYLDGVSLQITSMKIYIRRRRRFSPVSLIPPATRSRNSYMSSKRYVALGRFYQNRARFQTLF